MELEKGRRSRHLLPQLRRYTNPHVRRSLDRRRHLPRKPNIYR